MDAAKSATATFTAPRATGEDIDEILPRWGVESVFVDGTDLDAWRTALAEPAEEREGRTPYILALTRERPRGQMSDVFRRGR